VRAVRQSINAILLLSLLAAAPARAQVGLTQSSVSGGGGASTHGTLRLDGTVGQPAAGKSSGGTFTLDAGFHVATANGAPVNRVPGAQATDEDTALVFAGAGAVSVSDPDAGPANVRVTLAATHGTLTLGATSGLAFTPAGSANDGANDAQLVFEGSVAAVNAALDDLTFNPTANFHGAASLSIATDDLGHHGDGGGQSDADAVQITVNPVNDPPTAAGQSLTTDEEVPVAVTLSGADTETAGANLAFTVTAQPSHGTLSGTAPNLTYTPAGGYAGPDSFQFTATDAGDGAAAPQTSAEATVSISVAAVPDIFVRDARVAEPATGEAQMLFTVALERAATSPVSVDFNTAHGTPGPGAATAGSDYTTHGGTVTFQTGQRVQTLAVAVLHDSATEPDEIFLLQLSNASGGRINDGEATGTITQTNTPGTLIISELRTSGPGGAEDDFVEVYNNTGAPVTVNASDGSAGYGVFASAADCEAAPVLVGVIPNGTVIPARGHFLLTGGGYSLAAYGGTDAALGDAALTVDVEDDRNVALFASAGVAQLSSVNRLDAVGFGTNAGHNCALLREGAGLGPAAGSTLEHSFFRKLCDFQPGVGCLVAGTPKDTGDNAADFLFGDTRGTQLVGTGQRLAAPGPESLGSPRKTDAVGVALLDASAGAATPPNRVRDLSGAGNNPSYATFGTMSVRRRVINQTGAPVTRLRFRISEMTTFPVGLAGQADMRALTSVAVTVTGVNDPAACGANPRPCAVTVEGTTLEQPPAQAYGGGLNATLAVGVVTLAAPLPAGASVNVQFLLGVQQPGTFRFLIVTEALP
jgi:hypothetical protein